MKIYLYYLFSIYICLISAGEASQVYQWTDKNGIVHFSDNPGETNNQNVNKDNIDSEKFKQRLKKKLPNGFCEIIYKNNQKEFLLIFNNMSVCVQQITEVYDECFDKSLRDNGNVIKHSQIDNFSSKLSNCFYDKYLAINLKSKNIYLQNEQVNIGYFSYKVTDSVWTKSLSNNQYLNKPPYGIYVKINILIRNNDNKAREIPEFILIGEDKKHYSISSDSLLINESVKPFESINPDLVKTAILIFDVPKKQQYYLLINDVDNQNKLILIGDF
ncbi:Telomeric repeat-binding factor 2 [Legionella rubrilucens]|uniref:Telomeric repeat-binding factor 2 n=1 Tax=Legionella rubrilucens TaxID=458 RepID=A0A0W0XQH3_9GAMM|nr:DUF4352 domain-containing protein [Legionella rubrilucens]KTD46923.1 Telomeric repeat-binding factor 2 [Legionella rubrilucens]